jgi:hypothetical protein
MYMTFTGKPLNYMFGWYHYWLPYPELEIKKGREQHQIKGTFDNGKGHSVSSRKT